MIRPLEYCENATHLTASIETIDARILELINLRKQYIAEKKRILGIKDMDSTDFPLSNSQTQQLIDSDQLSHHEQE